MILYGASAEQSIPKLFAAGVLPGLLIAFMMSAYVVVMALRIGRAHHAGFDLRHFLRTTCEAGPALLMPVFILSGIYLGWFSPTEAGGFACLYAILVGRYVYRTMSWSDVLDCAVTLGDAHRADPGHRGGGRAVLLDPDHQRRPAGDHRRAEGARAAALGASSWWSTSSC